MEIRIAATEDAAAIRDIYDPYVENTAITFEYDVPGVEEFERRIGNTLKSYPYLVAIHEGKVVGYAYAGAFRPRAAYQHTVEVSVYVDKAFCGQGIGKHLYLELEKNLEKQNVFTAYACITMTDREDDEHLTDASIRFHTAMGYTLAGTFEKCGYKFEKWYGMIWMQKALCERPENPDKFIAFNEIYTAGRPVCEK